VQTYLGMILSMRYGGEKGTEVQLLVEGGEEMKIREGVAAILVL
jgi:hypothetical protein